MTLSNARLLQDVEIIKAQHISYENDELCCVHLLAYAHGSCYFSFIGRLLKLSRRSCGSPPLCPQPSISNFSPPLSLEPFSSIHPSSLQQSYLPQFGNNSMLLQACRVVQFNQADIRQLIDRTSTRPCIAMEFCVEKVSNTPALSYVKLN